MSASSLVVFGSNGRATDIVSARGKVTGQRLTFAGTESAAELRARLRAGGLKGRELDRKVNEVICGKADVRWVEFEASVSAMRSAGMVPDLVEVRKKTGTAKFVRPVDPEVAAREKLVLENEEKAKQLAAQEAELAEMRKQLAELQAAFKSRK